MNLPERLESDKPRIVSAVLRWLTTYQGWLLIFDNVEDLEVVKPFVPTAPHGAIIFTTRLQAVGNLAQPVTVETMGLAEGTLFLLRRAKLLPTEAFLDHVPSDLLANAEALVIELDFLPLALDQAGAYMEEVGCSPATYLELYHSRRKDLLQRRGHTPSDHPDAVATTWSLSFQHIEQRNPAAADLLRMCAFLEPDAIPEELLQEGRLTLGSLMHAVATDLLAFHEACEELYRFSLVQHDPQTRLLRIHRLVQAVLKDSMESQEQEQWIEHMLRTKDRVFPETVDLATWPSCQRYLPQTQVCSLWIKDYGFLFAEAAALLFRTAQYLQQTALYEQAEPLYQQAVYIQQQIFGSEHPSVAFFWSQLANLYSAQGKYQQAELLYQRALRIQELALGSEHPDIALQFKELARISFRLGRYEQAEPLYLRTLHIWEQTLGPAHSDMAHPLHNLAELYAKQRNYEQAEPLYLRVLHIWEQSFGPENPHMAHPLHGLATLASRQGKYEQAERLYHRTLQIREQALEPEHLDTAETLHEFAALREAQGKSQQAAFLYQRALAIREHVLGTRHHESTETRTRLCALLQAQGKMEKETLPQTDQPSTEGWRISRRSFKVCFQP